VLVGEIVVVDVLVGEIVVVDVLVGEIVVVDVLVDDCVGVTVDVGVADVVGVIVDVCDDDAVPVCDGEPVAVRVAVRVGDGVAVEVAVPVPELLGVAVCDDDEDPSPLVTPGLLPHESDLTHSAPEVLLAELALEASVAAPATSNIRAGQSWTVDSGATISMTSTTNALAGLTPVHPALRIRTAGPIGLRANHRGRLTGSYSVGPLDLGRALLVPDLQDNLLSVPALADAGFTISFKNN
jgi:hypothetical protein